MRRKKQGLVYRKVASKDVRNFWPESDGLTPFEYIQTFRQEKSDIFIV